MQISYLFAFIPSGSLAERSLCLIPTSPSPSCQYSPGEAGEADIAWAVWLEQILEVLARGFCHRDRSLPRWQLYDLGESWWRSSGCCRTSPGPGLGINAASGPGGALGGRSIIIQYGGGVRSTRPNPVEFPFLSSVNFCAINIFPFPFWIQNHVQVGGS